MRNFLGRLLATIKGKPRYHPEEYELSGKLNWSKELWISNVFRAFEWLFGREIGARPELRTHAAVYKGKLVIQREFYTLEAFVVNIEVVIRMWLKSLFTLSLGKPIPNYKWAYVTFIFFGFFISFKTKVEFLPFFGLAIAYDTATQSASGTSPTSPFTYSHTSTGSNLVMHLGGIMTGGTDNTGTVSYNSVSLTKIRADLQGSASSSIIFYLINPATGANTVSFGFSGSPAQVQVGTITMSGAKQSSQPNVSGGSNGIFTNPSVSVTTTVADCLVCDNYAGGGTPTVNASQTQRWNVSATFNQHAGSTKAQATAASVTMSWTGTNLIWALSVAAYASAPAGTGSMIPFFRP